MNVETRKQKQLLYAPLVAIVLLSSSLLVPTLSAYADNDEDKSKDDKKGKHDQSNEHHKKGKKDPDHDHDNDKKECKHGDTNKKGKYRHSCDSDHDSFP